MKKVFKVSRRSILRISFDVKHCAFTDLCHFNGELFCCYREATDHLSADGVIKIMRLSLSGQVLFHQRISVTGADLRDPKLSITDKNQLLLLAYARYTNENNQTQSTENLTWVSQTGDSWSSPTSLGLKFWWLWRVRYSLNHSLQTAYGFAYNRKANRIDLYSGDPLRKMHCVKQGALSLTEHKLGYPNESDLVIEDDGRINALVRRDADSFSAQFGYSYPPYTRWQWHDLGEYIGGPVLYRLDSEYCLVAGRAWTGETMVTRLWKLAINTLQLIELDTLPSAGDNSYPGIVIVDNTLFVSYYSSHIDQRSQLYLASYSLVNNKPKP